jgi:hypothetical protein
MALRLVLAGCLGCLIPELAMAAIVADHAAFDCGNGLSCQWWRDQQNEGGFSVDNPKAIAAARTLFQNQDFKSPSGAWVVHFTSIVEKENPFDDGWLISVAGYMEHLVNPGAGPELPFSLSVDFYSPVDRQPAKGLNFKDHTVQDRDYYASLLTSKPEDGQTYTFMTGANHLQHIWFQELETPEPATALGVGCGLAALFALRRRAQASRRAALVN